MSSGEFPLLNNYPLLISSPDDLKRLRETLITEAEKTRACIRIGNGIRPFQSPKFNGSSSAPSFVTLRRGNFPSESHPFRSSLKDITELSRAAAAISAARATDRPKSNITVTSTSKQTTTSTTTTRPVRCAARRWGRALGPHRPVAAPRTPSRPDR